MDESSPFKGGNIILFQDNDAFLYVGFVFTNQQATQLIQTVPTISCKLEMRRFSHNNIGEKRHSDCQDVFTLNGFMIYH